MWDVHREAPLWRNRVNVTSSRKTLVDIPGRFSIRNALCAFLSSAPCIGEVMRALLERSGRTYMVSCCQPSKMAVDSKVVTQTSAHH